MGAELDGGRVPIRVALHRGRNRRIDLMDVRPRARLYREHDPAAFPLPQHLELVADALLSVPAESLPANGGPIGAAEGD